MALPNLTELRTQLVSASAAIRASNSQPSTSLIRQLKEAFPNWKFKPACIEVETSGGRVIVFPYEWFQFAAIARPFYAALKQYKSIAIQAANGSEATIDNARSAGHITPAFKDAILSLVNGNVDDARKVEVFVTDYDSWGGGKSIARQQDDFHWSPILDALGLLAASSGFVVDLCEKLGELQQIPTLLIPPDGVEETNVIIKKLAGEFTESLNGCGFFNQEN